MRSLLIASFTVLISCLAHSAHAQGVPGTGVYVGATGGYGSGNSNQRDTVLPTAPQQEPGDGSYRVRGASVGLSGGYGFMLDKLLLGIEGDINLSGIDGASSTCGGTRVCGTRLEDYATLRGRTGLHIGNGLLAYVTGGLAVGTVRAFDRLDPAFDTSKARTGWTVGGGIEQKLAGAWSLKLEYLYMDLGRAEFFTLPNHTPERVDLDVHTVRLGLSYGLGLW